MRHVYIDAADHLIDASCVVLGIGNFTQREREDEAISLFDRYTELGGNVFDTARSYGDSEAILGQWLRGRSDRDRLTVITKGARPLTRDVLREDVEASLTALGTHIDLYMPHRSDGELSAEDVAELLDEYVRAHDIRAIGASNRTLGRVDEFNRIAFERGLSPFVASEVQWSLAVVNHEALRDACGEGCVGLNANGEYAGYRHRDTLLLAYSALAWGYFSKLIHGVTPRYQQELAGEENDHRLGLVRRWCEKTGRSAAEIALSYVVSHPEINAAAVVACQNVAQLDQIMHGGDYLLPYDFFEELGEVAVRV